MPFTYEYKCTACYEGFDQVRTMGDRNAPTSCPCCGKPAERVFETAPHVIWFPGSYTFDDRNDKLDRMAKEAQAEGFQSAGEIEAAEGQAAERAKQLGVPVSKILGGTKANFEGELKVDPKDQAKHKKLYQKYVETGLMGKDIRGAAKAKDELTQFETDQRKKHKNARKYKPTLTREDAAKAAKAQSKHFSNQT